MIFITGDTHGDWERLDERLFPVDRPLSKNDYLLVAGDFGLWHDTPNESARLDALERRSFTTFFVPGNHENYDRLDQWPLTEAFGGPLAAIRPSVLCLQRGYVYDIGGASVFAFGGAQSHDIEDGILEQDDPLFERKYRRLRLHGAMFRVNHLSWWARELPDQAEYERGLAALQARANQVDLILTHCAPTNIQKQIAPHGLSYHNNALTDYFQEIADHTQFRHWYFGHYHRNSSVLNRFHCLYEQIVPFAPLP